MSESSDKIDDTKKKDKRGILRLDINKPRNSAGSVEFREKPELFCEASPSPQSVGQLSVKWAFSKDNNLPNIRSTNECDVKTQSERVSYTADKRAKKSLSADYFGFHPYYDPFHMDPVEAPEYINSEDEDYSLSLSAVIQRRASVRSRKKVCYSPRRASSPMGHVSGVCGIPTSNSFVASKADRRRSSVYTTSSGETASLGDAVNNQESTKQQIFENIRLHKEVLQSVKLQPWSMRRKLRLVRQAREYIARHEGALQERFAMSRSTKDLWARFKIVLAVKWQHFRREFANLSTVFVAWQLRIKEIESHFGSAVASYFTFLRWLFWVNLVLALTLSVVILPEFFSSQFTGQDDHRKVMMQEELDNATSLTTFLNFEGYLKYSPLFYGYYSDYSGFARINKKISLPLLYFFAGVAVYIYSFWATLRKMAENSRMSKMSSKDDECIFSWKLFTGWDYMIGHAETAHNRIASVVLGFKEALLEEAEKKKDTQNWRVIALRVFVNIVVLCLLVLSAWAVVTVVELSSKPGTSYIQQNATSFLMTGISFFFPMFFEFLGYLEHYHPRKQLRWQLGRIMLLNLLNLFSMIIALFKKINLMNVKLDKYRQCPSSNDIQLIFNDTTTIMSYMSSDMTDDNEEFSTMATSFITATSSEFLINLVSNATPTMTSADFFEKCCVKMTICSKNVTTNAMLSLLLAMNFSTLIFPAIQQQMNGNGIFDDTSVIFNATNSDLYSNRSDYTTESFDMDDSYVSTSTDVAEFNEQNEILSLFDYDEDNWIDNLSDDKNNTTLRRSYRDNNSSDYNDNFTKISEATTELNGFTAKSFIDSNETTEIDDEFEKSVSLAVAAFIENSTFVIPIADIYNESYFAKLWMDFVMTMNDENYDPDCDDTAVYDLPSECGIEFDMNVCDNYTNAESVDDDVLLATSKTDERPRFEDRMSKMIQNVKTTPQSFTESSIPMVSISNSSSSQKPTLSSTNLTTNSSQACVPYKQNGDQITGISSDYVGEELSRTIKKLAKADQLELREMCWETIFGQELFKLTVFDLVFNTFTILFMDFFRALFVRFMNKCWCWDLEKRYPKYGDFKIAENILHLVNNQGQVWMGLFFSPGLAILNLIKLGILMYLRSWAVLTCNVPHEVVFRASRSNNFYLTLLLTMLFLCVLPVSYAIVWIEPSWHCGPFANHAKIYRVFTDTLKSYLPPDWHLPLDIIASPSTVIPLLLLLILIIYYLVSLTGALREANQDLKNQLRRERQEERRKMLQRVVNAKLDDSGGNNAIDRWRKVLEASSPVTPNMPGQPSEPDEEKIKARALMFMKKALRKSSNTSDDDSHAGDECDETDTEQHEPLPHDQETHGEKRNKNSNSRLSDDRKDNGGNQRKLSFSRMRDIVEIARRKSEQFSDGSKLIATNESIDEEKRAIIETNQNNHDKDEYSKMSIVSERRALRRQQNARESEGSLSQRTLPDTTKYNTVHERTRNVRRGAIKSNVPRNVDKSPEMFEFSPSITKNSETKMNENNEFDTGNANFAEIESKNPKRQVQSCSKYGSNVTIKSSSSSIRAHSPEEAAKMITIRNSSSRGSTDSNTKDQTPIPSPPSNEKLYQEEVINKQPIKKLNSFLALVRDAVQTRKHEHQQQQQCVIDDIIQGRSQSRIKTFIDDSNSVSVSEEGTSTKTTTDSATVPMRKQKRSDPPKPKRQDSQASIWSESIPVITISKSESDECILEREIENELNAAELEKH